MKYFRLILPILLMVCIPASRVLALNQAAPKPTSTAGISTEVQRTPDPELTICCAVNDRETLLCAVENEGDSQGVTDDRREQPGKVGKVGLWELPSGRFIKEYYTPSSVSAVFFRGEDLILVSGPIGMNAGDGVSSISCVNAITGTESNPPLTMPSDSQVEGYSERDDCLLLFNRESQTLMLFNIGQGRVTHSFEWGGNNEFNDYAFSIIQNNMIVSFGGEAADGVQPVDNYVCFSFDGEVIARGSPPAFTTVEEYVAAIEKMFEKLADRMNIPSTFFNTDYFSNREGRVGESSNDANQLSLFRSIQKWGAHSTEFVVNLSAPASVWLPNLSTPSKTLVIPGPETYPNTLLAADSGQRRYFTWNVNTFLNRDKRSQPYCLDLSTMTWTPVSLPADTGVLNATMMPEGKLAICFGAYRPGPDPEGQAFRIPELAISRSIFEFGQQPKFGNILGNIRPYTIAIDLYLDMNIAITASRNVLSLQSDDDVRRRLTESRKTNLSFWREVSDAKIETAALSDNTVFKWSGHQSTVEVFRDNLPYRILQLPANQTALAAFEISGSIILATTSGFARGALYSLKADSLEVQDTCPIDALEFSESIGFSTSNSEVYVNDRGTIHIVKVSNDGDFLPRQR